MTGHQMIVDFGPPLILKERPRFHFMASGGGYGLRSGDYGWRRTAMRFVPTDAHAVMIDNELTDPVK